MIDWIKPRTADALTWFRLIGSPLIMLPLFLTGHWMSALVLFWFLALSDALDGPTARRWGHIKERTAQQYHKFDNDADGALAFSLVAGVVGRLFLARRNDWWDGVFPVGWIVAAVVLAAVITPTFILLTAKFKNGPYYDVAHGLYNGLLLTVCAFFATLFAVHSVDGDVTLFKILWTLQCAVIFVTWWLKWGTIMTPRWGRADYNGTKTWKTLFSRS